MVRSSLRSLRSLRSGGCSRNPLQRMVRISGTCKREHLKREHLNRMVRSSLRSLRSLRSGGCSRNPLQRGVGIAGTYRERAKIVWHRCHKDSAGTCQTINSMN